MLLGIASAFAGRARSTILDMLTLEDLRMIRALGSVGSLAGAARQMDLTPPALTIRLRKLEERLGVALAIRGPRGMALTDEGRSLLDESIEVLRRIDSMPERISREAGAVTGHLRVVAPFGFGRAFMAPLVVKMRREHPSLTIALTLSDSPLRDAMEHDLVVHIGAIRDSSWVSHLLAPNGRVLCASPSLARALAPRLEDPMDLQHVECLCLRENDDDVTRWRFRSKALDPRGRPVQTMNIRVSGPLSSNDGEVVRHWALDGMGVAARSEWDVGPLIAAGRLVRLLPRWEMEPAPILALVPSRKGMSARVRSFIEAAKAAFDPPPWRTRG